jgi:hypothetical protein
VPESALTDPGRLRQIVTNLIGNSIKFTASGGVSVSMQVRTAAGRPIIAIDVIDTGIGIPPEKLDAIFEPFVQAETSTTRKFGGTGLGLTISRRFARAMAGDIVVHSETGKGSVFTITFDPGSLAAYACSIPSKPQPVRARSASIREPPGSFPAVACWWSMTAMPIASWYVWCWRRQVCACSRPKTARSGWNGPCATISMSF